MLLEFLITAFILTKTSANNKCSSQSPAIVPKYNLIEKCYRSTLGIAAKANFASLISCQRLGIEKKALALNFSPLMSFKDGDGVPLEYTCEVLKCAEADGGLSLTNDSRFDYYSIYGKPLPSVNSTCVPATGMFLLLPKRRNYTQAQARCGAASGVLADVSSDQRTDSLSLLLASAGVSAAYVGMWSRNGSGFYIDSTSDSLDCTTYRAWAPGFPRKRTNMTCVILTRSRTWKTSPCKAKFQAICELIPGGPYKRGSIFPSRLQNGTQASAVISDF